MEKAKRTAASPKLRLLFVVLTIIGMILIGVSLVLLLHASGGGYVSDVRLRV